MALAMDTTARGRGRKPLTCADALATPRPWARPDLAESDSVSAIRLKRSESCCCA